MTLNSNNKIKLFITVEQQLYRDVLLFELVNQKDIDLVGDSSSGNETLRLLDHCSPSTLIIEENLKEVDGQTIAEMALLRHPSLTVILLVDAPINQSRLAIYLDSGIKSVISKTQSIQDLNQSIHYTRNGQIYIDPDQYMPQPNHQNPFNKESKKALPLSKRFYALSEREQEVARFIAEHVPLKIIAETLGVSHKTIHTYKERIFIKLGFERLPELIVFMKRLSFYQTQEELGL